MSPLFPRQNEIKSPYIKKPVHCFLIVTKFSRYSETIVDSFLVITYAYFVVKR